MKAVTAIVFFIVIAAGACGSGASTDESSADRADEVAEVTPTASADPTAEPTPTSTPEVPEPTPTPLPEVPEEGAADATEVSLTDEDLTELDRASALVFPMMLLGGFGVDLDDAAIECISEPVADFTSEELMMTAEGAEVLASRFDSCIPDLDNQVWAGFVGQLDALTEVERDCLLDPSITAGDGMFRMVMVAANGVSDPEGEQAEEFARYQMATIGGCGAFASFISSTAGGGTPLTVSERDCINEEASALTRLSDDPRRIDVILESFFTACGISLPE